MLNVNGQWHKIISFRELMMGIGTFLHLNHQINHQKLKFAGLTHSLIVKGIGKNLWFPHIPKLYYIKFFLLLSANNAIMPSDDVANNIHITLFL